jgi:hypothetical protein
MLKKYEKRLGSIFPVKWFCTTIMTKKPRNILSGDAKVMHNKAFKKNDAIELSCRIRIRIKDALTVLHRIKTKII